ncbi:DUF5677 domain-containing protein [Paracoccus sp. SSK6]|uniref:DUF5677 domain-containing protein n=1 Tax=Paracoccus sp. SSK6 TaxID=3143131 RepID=UPI00321A8BF9
MKLVEEMIDRASDRFIEDGLDLQNYGDFINKAIETAVEKVSKESVKSYKSKAAERVAEYEADDAEFASRNLRHWRPAFDHLEMLWHISRELGQAHQKDYIERKSGQCDVEMTALGMIFAKALLVAREVICLMKGGYPDGALGRWRVLHELAVSAAYIREKGEIAAKEYLVSAEFSTRRAAVQFNQYAEKLEAEPYSPDEMISLDENCRAAEKFLGRSISDDRSGEWPKITGKNDMSQLEVVVGMQQWRPWYKKASAHNHANYEPPGSLLGAMEDEITLIGPSNYGMVYPFQGTALNLAKIVASYLSLTPNVDRLAYITSLDVIASEMVEIALRAEQNSLEATKS